MNNKAHLRPKDFDSNGDIIPTACKDEAEEALREARREAMKLDDNEDSLKWRFTH